VTEILVELGVRIAWIEHGLGSGQAVSKQGLRNGVFSALRTEPKALERTSSLE